MTALSMAAVSSAGLVLKTKYHPGTIGSSGADTGTAAPTPDYQALRDTRPGEQGRGEELGTDQGPATTAETRVDEEMGGSGT